MPRRFLAAIGLALALAPSTVSALEVVGTSAQFAWAPASGPVLGYVVYVSRNGAPFPPAGSQFSSVPSARVDGAVGDSVVIAAAALGPGGVLGPVSEFSDPVRFVASASPPAISLSSDLLVVSAIARAATPPATLSVVNSGGGTLGFSVTPLTPLVQATPATGTSATAGVPISLSLDTLSLDAGVYYTGVQVSAPGTASRWLPIVLNVFPPIPSFTVSQPRISARTPIGQAPPATTLTVTSSIPGSGYTVSSDAPWIRVTPGDAVAAIAPGSVQVTLDATGLARGAHSGHVYVIPVDARSPTLTTSVTLTVVDPAAAPRKVGPDLDGDGRADLIFRDRVSGDLLVWLMNGTLQKASARLRGPIPAESWVVAAVADLDGDGRSDIVWQSPASGFALAWFMNGLTPVQAAVIPTPGLGWQIAAADDVDGDGRADLVHLRPDTGDLGVWLMRGAVPTGLVLPDLGDEAVDRVIGTGDFDATGTADILWRSKSGATLVWLSNGRSRGSQTALSLPGETGWAVASTGDQDGDGTSDLVLRNDTLRETQLWRFESPTVIDVLPLPPMRLPGWLLAAGADFDGDGRSDLLWRNAGTGATTLWLMNGAILRGGASLSSPPPATWDLQHR